MNAQGAGNPEPMGEFFDTRAGGYDDHMRTNAFSGAEYAQFYQALASPIEKTERPLRILDLGCGTGAEIEMILERAPNAAITGIDLSAKMLAVLRERYADRMSQITLVADSYLTLPFPNQRYDYVVSAMTAHHLLHDTKRTLYRKIHGALKRGGKYIEGDSVTSAEMQDRFLEAYRKEMDAFPHAADGHYHVDIPLSIDTQRSLLLASGFRSVEVIWEKDPAAVWNAAVTVSTA